ncbi:hypothetical protein J2Z44_000597 [Clostridium punense]|uniref:Uncharacterized protein n=1 Tax=Clostridium punense TaxID=1054297 RepID=A0ABS4JZ62_9CLOT|nr:hypothetical protein M918_01840 [Clostridium sp. BL8]MBP2020813.1 hypothetical protein [Clostridium punense]
MIMKKLYKKIIVDIGLILITMITSYIYLIISKHSM